MRSWNRSALAGTVVAALVACGSGRPAEGRAPAPPPRPGQAMAAAPAPAAVPAPVPVPPQAARPSLAGVPSLAPLVESVKAAVVNVEVRSRSSGEMNQAARELWERFFGQV